ncbi:aspartic proteinase CDR1-like [Prosopis cineraria]|uniref:aspartic proteinase CDR1-like n=1 Tax=Prosopis cineraria TaxID=364024 RepID=UPI00240F7288|nr:aspartic proteinase CDR1-like [Prosopis cineraria]XP_054813286.1 aspartic proteinase CDR1-like [Prosopis cineraria]
MAKAYTLSVLSITFFFLTFTISLSESSNGGFTVDLIHRDSPKSPLSTPKTMPFQYIHDAIRRSTLHASYFFPEADHHQSLNDVAESDVVSVRGEYVMSYSVGTPPFEIFGIADTGSDLIWTQCKPCDECYNQTAPLFDPRNSRTFQKIPCSSQQCSSVHSSVGQTTCDASSVCGYNAVYGDSSTSNGDIAIDTITLGSSSGRRVAFPKTVFGCGFSNRGTFNEKTSGIVGLGGGSVSLVSQIGSSIDGKFAYCLVPLTSDKNTSKLSFGQNAVVSGPGTVSTPIVPGRTSTFYLLTLEAMSVGDKRFEFTSSGDGAVSEGNIIIDSGTTLTLLPEDFYSNLESEVASQIKLERARVPQDLLNLCYRLPSDNSFEVPTITVHFKGADLKLNSFNAFVQVSDDVVCFAFKAYPSGSIFGNVAQMNFLVGYDLQKKTVSFKPVDCTTKM